MFMGGICMNQSSLYSRLLVAIAAAIAAVALLAPAASATEPNPGYGQYAGCPDSVEAPNVTVCIRSEITGGHFQMGTKDVPIEKTIVLSGGYNTSGTEFRASPKGGLIPVKQKVPGGVTGLTGLTWLLEFFGSEALTLYAVTEAAGLPGPPLADPLTLPIKVHLETPSGVLGKTCYVGSFTTPIKLNLTKGTTSPPLPNKPITGKEGTFEAGTSPESLRVKDAEYVDNSFAAPGASGCVLTLFGFIPISINGLVNSQSGLPSPAGKNETRQINTTEVVSQELVY
jgi:hypothetical protein